MFGANGYGIYQINTSTGATTLVGLYNPPAGYPITGLAFSPPIPEPSALILAAFALVPLFCRRKSITHKRI